MSAVRLSATKFSEGDRVYLGGDHGQEPYGRIVDLVVTAYVIAFDDDELIEIGADDPDLVPDFEAP